MGRASPEQLISRAIGLLQQARRMLEKVGAGKALDDLNRAITSATFARGAAALAEKNADSVPPQKKPRRRGK